MACARRREEWERCAEMLSWIANGPASRKDGRHWKSSDFNLWPKPVAQGERGEVTLTGDEFIQFLRGR